MAATLGGLLDDTRRRFRAAGIETADLDARLLVTELVQASMTDAIARPHLAVAADAAERLGAAVLRRLAGEPVHRILGWREFHGLRLSLSAGTLEPRPDTECLVDGLVPYAQDAAARHGECRVLDLGTGTGAIALALVAAVPGSIALATDISDDALATARRNAQINGLDRRLAVAKADWLDGVEGDFHIIVSNPPYVASDHIQQLPLGVRQFDPEIALDGGEDGLDCYRSIAGAAREYLVDDGVVGVEFGFGQAGAVARIFAESGFDRCASLTDLAGHDRAAIFR